MLVLSEGKAQVTLNDFHFCPLGMVLSSVHPLILKMALVLR